MSVQQKKAALHREIKMRTAVMTTEETAISDRQIVQRLIGLPVYRSANTVFCFVSAAWEINTIPLLEDMLHRGVKTAVPLCAYRPV